MIKSSFILFIIVVLFLTLLILQNHVFVISTGTVSFFNEFYLLCVRARVFLETAVDGQHVSGFGPFSSHSSDSSQSSLYMEAGEYTHIHTHGKKRQNSHKSQTKQT